MAVEKSLKSQIVHLLWIFIGINIVMFWCLHFVPKLSLVTIDTLNEMWNKIALKDGIILATAPLLTFILNGILSANVKAILVFWRYPNPLPGSRVFTRLALNDPRINLGNLSKTYGDLPHDPLAQNKLWYQIYLKNRPKVTVKESHKNYLLSRDITGISFILFLVFPVASFVIDGNQKVSGLYLLGLLVQFSVVSLVARNYGNRFACNVLAEEIRSGK